MRIIGYNRSGKYTIDGKTGFVAFFWDGKEFPGEGLQFDQATPNFLPQQGWGMGARDGLSCNLPK